MLQAEGAEVRGGHGRARRGSRQGVISWSLEQQAVQFVLAGNRWNHWEAVMILEQSQPLRPQFPSVYNRDLFSRPPLPPPHPVHTPP